MAYSTTMFTKWCSTEFRSCTKCKSELRKACNSTAHTCETYNLELRSNGLETTYPHQR